MTPVNLSSQFGRTKLLLWTNQTPTLDEPNSTSLFFQYLSTFHYSPFPPLALDLVTSHTPLKTSITARA